MKFEFRYVILIAALILAIISGWFSVNGIMYLFSGAMFSAGLMAGSLELAKVVSVSFLYRYWTDALKGIKHYMLVGVVILSLITSAGVYGFLTAAYSQSAVQYNFTKSQITAVQDQINTSMQLVESDKSRISMYNDTRMKQESRLDSLVGKNGFVTQQRVLEQDAAAIKNLETSIQKRQDRIDSLRREIFKADSILNTSSSKLRTFDYVAEMLNISLDSLVKWFVLIIVFVFDPMSMALFVAYNTALKSKPESEIAPFVPSNELQNIEEVPDEIAPVNVVVEPGTEIPAEPISESERAKYRGILAK